MRRNTGDHLKWNEVKTGIIEFIIRSDGAIPEPEIRKFLAREYEIKNLGTIKKHLKDLQHRPYSCIEKIPGKKGYANRWDIKRIEQLKNIRLTFPRIRLNIYEKALNIISKKRNFNQSNPKAERLHTQILFSASFFDVCLNNDIETLYAKADEICTLSRGATPWRYLPIPKNSTKTLYTKFMKILANPNIWLDFYNECMNDSLKSELGQKSLQFSEEVEMSEERFQEIIEEALPIQYAELQYEELYKIMVKYISIKIASEIITQKMSKEMNTELVKKNNEILVKQLTNVVKKMSEEIFDEILVKENWIEMYHGLLQIVNFEQKDKLIGLELLFDHCLQRDIVDGNMSSESKKLFYEEQEFFYILKVAMDKNLPHGLKYYDEDCDNFLNYYFEKCKAKKGIP